MFGKDRGWSTTNDHKAWIDVEESDVIELEGNRTLAAVRQNDWFWSLLPTTIAIESIQEKQLKLINRERCLPSWLDHTHLWRLSKNWENLGSFESTVQFWLCIIRLSFVSIFTDLPLMSKLDSRFAKIICPYTNGIMALPEK